MYNDKNLTCADCGQEFVFTASEQDFYAQRGFTEPRRCPSCRASRKAARNAEGGGSSYGGYGAGGGYSAGGSRWRLRWRRWRLRRPRPRPARDVRGDLLELRHARPRSRSARPAASPSTAATASGACAAADHILSARADPRPAEPASIPDPGRQPTRVAPCPRRSVWPPLGRRIRALPAAFGRSRTPECARSLTWRAPSAASAATADSRFAAPSVARLATPRVPSPAMTHPPSRPFDAVPDERRARAVSPVSRLSEAP